MDYDRLNNSKGMTLRSRRPFIVRLALAVLMALTAATAAQSSPAVLPEQSHFDATKFLIGLRQKGLFDLQAAYMQTYPPSGPAETAWYAHERKLAEAFGSTVPLEARLTPLKTADALALEAIEHEGDSPRAVLWRIDRAQTWFYGVGQPLFEQVLFYGRTPKLKQNLKEAAGLAVSAYDDAMTSIDAYLERLATPEGATPDVRRLNLSVLGMLQRLQFERCWAQLYQAIALDRTDLDQGLLAGGVIRSLQELHLLDGNDAQENMQAQSLLMAAIASRLSGDWPTADLYAQKTQRLLQSSQAAQTPEMAWVSFAAQVERGRLLLDQGRFTEAATELESIRRAIQGNPNLDATVKVARSLSLAMLQFEAMSLAADSAAAKGDLALQARYAQQRFDAVYRLAEDAFEYRSAIYQMVADRMGDVATVAGLPPFGKAVFANKWLNEKKYEQALAAAESLDRDTATAGNYLNRDAAYFKALCYQNLKHTVPAAEAWLRLARDPKDSRAKQAAITAMALVSQDKVAIDSTTGRAAFVQAGEILLRLDPSLIQRQNWVLPLAEAALEEGRYDRAVELFEMVPRDNPHYAYAVAGRIRAIAGKLRVPAPGQDQATARRQAEATVAEANALAKDLRSGKNASASQPGQDREMLAGKVLLAAARLCVDPLGDADRALKMLDGMESRWKEQPAMLSQLLGVKIQALQAKGDLTQATQMVDQMVAANPDTAGPLMLSLLAQMQREIEEQKLAGKADTEKEAALALNLAERLEKWGAAHPDLLKPQLRYAIRVRLARTMLQAGQIDRALTLFDALAQEDASRSGGQTRDAVVLQGQADSLMAKERWVEARQVYQEIWRRAQVRSELWWRAIYQSLQCSMNLKEDPARLYKVIRQHRDLYPDMGGPEMSKMFEEMSFKLIKRIQATSAATQPQSSVPRDRVAAGHKDPA